MTKKDIKEGDFVLLRDGRVCVVMEDVDNPNNGLVLYGMINSPIGFLDPTPKNVIGKVIHLYNFNDDLTSSDGYSSYDIMAIRKTSDYSIEFSVTFIFHTLFYRRLSNRLFWNWEREEIKEVTMAEVEEKFGCKVKIVKEEDDE